jgi:hypothetical protein
MAQKQGYGAFVGDRDIRTELANARSTGYLSRHDGDAISPADLDSIFENLAIISTWAPTQSERAVHNLSPGGRFVDFKDHGTYTKALKVNTRPLPSPLLLKPILMSSSETGSLQRLSVRPTE